MRIRVTAAAVTICGALTLSVLAVPGAQAAGGPTITKVVVNGGKNIVVSPTTATNFTATVTASDPSGVIETGLTLWYGSGSYNDAKGWIASSGERKCIASSSTTTTCTIPFQVIANPRALVNEVTNSLAGTWHVSASAFSRNRVQTVNESFTTVKVQRASQLTVNATPEPVKKDATITVTGKLSRANWDTHKYAGYASQPVKLQFRAKSSGTYTTVKTITTSSAGTLSTTVKAMADGYYRYSFAGTSTTPAANATGDFVDVQ
ncbi:calcium-binding protein [Streptomyces sp. NPDC002133]|uniref:DUF5707 domain-containing protein n=1 Tax=Streptomyces sp. NPDC002133 TaxID=3154409 RepID=UPI00331FA12E